MTVQSKRLWLCEVVRLDELELECESKQVYFNGDTESNFSNVLCNLFDVSSQTSFKLFNSDGHCLPLGMLVNMLNDSEGGVCQLQQVNVLESESGPIRISIAFQKATKPLARPVVGDNVEEVDDEEEGDEDDPPSKSKNATKPYTEAARIAFSLYGPRHAEGHVIGKGDLRFTTTDHADYEYFNASTTPV